MIVTEMIPLTKNRYKIYIDNEFAFVLYKGELHIYQIDVGNEVSIENFEEIVTKLLPKRAKMRAMNLLQKRTYTEKQLTDKLRDGFYPEDVIEDAINYVKSFRYIDDLRYAVDYITYYGTAKPMAKLREDLMRRGIRKETFEAARLEWERVDGTVDEAEMVKQLLDKKGYSEEMDIKEKRRIYAYLVRKGFSSDTITRAMKNLT